MKHVKSGRGVQVVAIAAGIICLLLSATGFEPLLTFERVTGVVHFHDSMERGEPVRRPSSDKIQDLWTVCFSDINTNQRAGVEIDSHRRSSIMIRLAGFPGVSLPFQSDSSRSCASDQSTSVSSDDGAAGTTRATVLAGRSTRLCGPSPQD